MKGRGTGVKTSKRRKKVRNESGSNEQEEGFEGEVGKSRKREKRG